LGLPHHEIFFTLHEGYFQGDRNGGNTAFTERTLSESGTQRSAAIPIFELALNAETTKANNALHNLVHLQAPRRQQKTLPAPFSSKS
jgi:hypothetical protein